MRDRMHLGRSDRSAEGVKRFLSAYRFGRCVGRRCDGPPLNPRMLEGSGPISSLPGTGSAVFVFCQLAKLPPPPVLEGGEVRAIIPRRSGGPIGGWGCGLPPCLFSEGGVKTVPTRTMARGD